MKIFIYRCNFCNVTAESMNSVVIASDEPHDYILGYRAHGDFHVCRQCICKLQKTFVAMSETEEE